MVCSLARHNPSNWRRARRAFTIAARSALTQPYLAKMHFWLHNLGLPIAMAGLFIVLQGERRALPLVVIGSITVVAGIACFVSNVMRTLSRDRPAIRVPQPAAGNFFDEI